MNAYNLADYSHRTQIFYGNGQYVIPNGVTSVLIIAIGAGGGGGGGFTRASGFGGGGGGGGTGEISKILIPKIFLTDSLIINIGDGGTSGLEGANGGLGGTTFVDMVMGQLSTLSGVNQTVTTRIIAAQGGGGGNPGTISVDGAGGPAATASTSASMTMVSLGPFTTKSGIAGGSGNGAGIYGTGSIPLSSGRGGGSVSAANAESAGGSISGRGFVPNRAGGAVKSDGLNGYITLNPFIVVGGTGGGSFHLGTGGRGGFGGPGCGGGGGGSGAAGGAGGRGGDGLVIITCW